MDSRCELRLLPPGRPPEPSSSISTIPSPSRLPKFELVPWTSSSTLLEELLAPLLLKEVEPSTPKRRALLLLLLLIRILAIVEPVSEFWARGDVSRSREEGRKGRTGVGEDFVGFVDGRHLLLRSSLLVRVRLQSCFPAAKER